jgi:hypothetical protein
MSLEKIYICKFCDKKFKTSQSRSNHYGKFHKEGKLENVVIDVVKNSDKSDILPEKSKSVVENVVINSTETGEKEKLNTICKFCNKKLCDRFYKWKHEQKCYIKVNKIESEEDKVKILEKKLEEMEKIQSQLLKTIKIHPKTLQKINNQLNNINNGTINNITNNIIIPNSQQNLKSVLNNNEKLSVLSSGRQAHIKLTDILYKKDEYKSFRNIYITNLSNDIGYIYDNKEKRFIVKSKKDIMDDYGVERFSDIQYFYEELGHRLNDSKKLQNLKKIVNDYFNNNDFKDIKNKEMFC